MKQLRVIGEVVLYLSAGLLFGSIFYRQICFSGFDLVLGDVGDARFNNVILEHWWQMVQGRVPWLSPSFFYPVQEVLGYSDAGFLNAIPYVMLRALNLDRFVAGQIVIFVWIVLGWIGSILCFRVVLRLGVLATLLGAVLFVFPNAMAASSAHTQLWTVFCIPYLAIALFLFVHHFWGRARVRIVAGVFLAIMLPAVLYTSFYTGWFCMFFVVLLGGVVCTWAAMQSDGITQLRNILLRRRTWQRLCPYGLLFLICLIPFLRTYIPAMLTFGSREYQEVVHALPEWMDYFNIGTGNWMWGAAFSSLFPDIGSRPGAYELAKGLPPCSLICFLACSVYFIRKVGRTAWVLRKEGFCKKSVFPDETFRIWIAGVLAVTVLLAWALLFRVNGFSLWWLVFKLVPGAGSIRAVYRFQHVLIFPIAVVLAIGLHQIISGRARRKIRGLFVAGLWILLIVEQFNAGGLVVFSRQSQSEMLSKIPAPPQSARVFGLWPLENYSGNWYSAHIDAMVLAQKLGIRTINGYSGQMPPGWSYHMHLNQDPHYAVSLYQWIRKWNLDTNQVYFLDLEAARWFGMEEFCRRAPVQTMSGPLSPDGVSLKISGHDFSAKWRAGEERACRIHLVNKGRDALCGIGNDPEHFGKYAVCLAYCWVAEGISHEDFNNRTILPKVLMPGEAMDVEMNIIAPAVPGIYRLKVEAVQECVAWFKDWGSPGFSAIVDVYENKDEHPDLDDRCFSGISGSVGINFQEDISSQDILQVTGLSSPEPWGTWSDEKQVVLEFSSPLPEKFTLHLVASAFGPNVGKEIEIAVGGGTALVVLDAIPKKTVAGIDNSRRSNRMTFYIPTPSSPMEQGVGDDDRKLGIGFVKLHIVPIN